MISSNFLYDVLISTSTISTREVMISTTWMFPNLMIPSRISVASSSLPEVNSSACDNSSIEMLDLLCFASLTFNADVDLTSNLTTGLKIFNRTTNSGVVNAATFFPSCDANTLGMISPNNNNKKVMITVWMIKPRKGASSKFISWLVTNVSIRMMATFTKLFPIRMAASSF